MHFCNDPSVRFPCTTLDYRECPRPGYNQRLGSEEARGISVKFRPGIPPIRMSSLTGFAQFSVWGFMLRALADRKVPAINFPRPTTPRTPMNKSLLLASLVAAVALSACGKKEEAPAPAPAPAAAPAPAPAPAVAEAASAAASAVAGAAAGAASAVADAAKDAAGKAVEAAASAVKK